MFNRWVRKGKQSSQREGQAHGRRCAMGDSSRLLVHLELCNGGGGGCDAREGGEANLGRALCHAKELGFVLKASGNYARAVSKGMRFLF